MKLKYVGISSAKITKEAEKALFDATLIIISPSNPLVSIRPIIEIPGFKSIIQKNKKRHHRLSKYFCSHGHSFAFPVVFNIFAKCFISN